MSVKSGFLQQKNENRNKQQKVFLHHLGSADKLSGIIYG